MIEYIEEFSEPMARQLEAAQTHPDPIDPTYANDQCRKIAAATWKVLRKFVEETDGRKLVKAYKKSNNVFEIWRLMVPVRTYLGSN